MSFDWKDKRKEIGINWEWFSGCNSILLPDKFKYDSISLSRIDFLSVLFPESDVRANLLRSLNMTEKEELFAKFFSSAYNKGKDISKMDFTELDVWIQELEKTVFEAKATLQGASQAKREREANLKDSEREKIRQSDSNHVSSDAINAVKKRKDRMSKIEKLEETYKALGMSDADIKELLGKVKPDETISQSVVNSTTGKLTGISNPVFNGSPIPINTCPDCNTDYEHGTKHDCSKKKSLIDNLVDNIMKKAEAKKDEKPFDPSGLF